jgi:hypothetical protein
MKGLCYTKAKSFMLPTLRKYTNHHVVTNSIRANSIAPTKEIHEMQIHTVSG